LLALVRESAANLGNVAEEVWRAALGAGCSDAQLSEASVHHPVRADLDLPAAPGLSPPAVP
jgi:hypothetical protein